MNVWHKTDSDISRKSDIRLKGRPSVIEGKTLLKIVEQQTSTNTHTLSVQSTIIHHHYKLVNRCCQKVPNELTNYQAQHCVNNCWQILKLLVFGIEFYRIKNGSIFVIRDIMASFRPEFRTCCQRRVV